jgi:preprotein translocase subunit YajC
MLGSFAGWFQIFAQAGAAGAGKPDDPHWLWGYAPLIAILPVFYLMMFRPQQQQDKKRRELIDNLKKNDKVLTIAGIYGTVISVDEKGDRVQLRLDDDGKVKVTFTKASIVRVLNESTEKPADSNSK